MKTWKMLVLCFLFLPLVVGAETISWTLPSVYVDNTAIGADDKARITIYLRGWKAGSPLAKTYFGETRNGATSWTDNVLVRMNEWGASNAVPGWVPLVAGDNVFITASAALVGADGVERDGPETAPEAWTLPGATVPCAYAYSAWSACQPNGTQTRTVLTATPSGCAGTPVLTQSCTYVPPTPSCNPPTGLTIRQ